MGLTVEDFEDLWALVSNALIKWVSDRLTILLLLTILRPAARWTAGFLEGMDESKEESDGARKDASTLGALVEAAGARVDQFSPKECIPCFLPPLPLPPLLGPIGLVGRRMGARVGFLEG